MLSVLTCGCEVHKPRKSGLDLNASLRADERGEGSEPVGAGSRKMLPVQVAEAFSFAEAVELGRDDCGGGLGELQWRRQIFELSECLFGWCVRRLTSAA